MVIYPGLQIDPAQWEGVPRQRLNLANAIAR